jgi:hypothetical protein
VKAELQQTEEIQMKWIVVVMALLAACCAPAQASHHRSKRMAHHAVHTEHHAFHKARSGAEEPASTGKTVPYNAYRA